MLNTLLMVIAPVLISAGIGFTWARLGRAFDVALVTALITNVGAPCLIFHTLTNLTVSLIELGTMMAATAAAISACCVIGIGMLRLTGLPVRAYLPAVMFPNTGNMGIPLCYLAYGGIGLGLALGVFIVHTVGMFTIGAALASGQPLLRGLLRVPVLYAVIAALFLLTIGTKPPAWVNSTTKLLGDMTIPMMLITLGVSLGRLGVRNLRPSLTVALMRLAVGFAVAWSLTRLLGLEGPAAGVLVVQLSMPVAVFNYLFAQRYDAAAAEVAGAVVISTALSFVTLPVLLWMTLPSPS